MKFFISYLSCQEKLRLSKKKSFSKRVNSWGGFENDNVNIIVNISILNGEEEEN